VKEDTDRREEYEPGTIARWLDLFLDSRGALLEPAQAPGEASPVVLRQIEPTNGVLVDVGGVPFVRKVAKEGSKVVMSRVCGDHHVATAPLSIRELRMEEERVLALLSFPECLLVTRRRREFRAKLRRDLRCQVALSLGSLHEPLQGELINLSMSGCKVRFPLDVIHISDEAMEGCGITLSFPNGEHIALECNARYFDPILDRGQAFCGFEFINVNSLLERVLWHSVCEIEGEAARSASTVHNRPPSRLFVAPDDGKASSARSRSTSSSIPATTMIRELSDVGNGVGVLLYGLVNRGLVESSILSTVADSLLSLHQRDRQELLFALAFHRQQPSLIRHCLGVAVRLTDVARQLGMPPEYVKTVAACALVHDLPFALAYGNAVDPGLGAQRPPEALAAVSAALKRCGWLPVSVVEEVVEQVSEGQDCNDGPRGLSAGRVGHLARVAAVIDVIDLCSRISSENGEPLMSLGAIRDWLHERDARFARRWVDYCFSLFGPIPIGASVVTQTGERFWLRRRHDDGSCASLVPCLGGTYPSPKALRMELTGAAVEALGPLAEVGATV
jgi:hypothetical protein